MEQQKRMGRPPMTPKESTPEQAAPVKSKKPVSYNYKGSEEPLAVVYEIKANAGIAYMLSQTNVTVYDKEVDSVRQIRYCPNENSVFVDEQSINARKEAVIFRNGNLIVPREKPNLRKFLELHPQNVANGGSLFQLVDDTKDVEQELAKEFDVFEAVSLVRDKSIDDLLPVAMFYGINVDRPVSDIKYDLLNVAKRSPHDFVKSFDNPIVKTRSVIHRAFEYNIVKAKNDGCYWVDSDGLIVVVPVGQDHKDTLARFCMTERGASVLSAIEDRLTN